MIPAYESKNIDETLAAIDHFDGSQLQQFLVFEREHKNRKGVITAVRDMLVTVRVPNGGYYEGFWFDEGGEHVLRDSQRLQRAVTKTQMEIVE